MMLQALIAYAEREHLGDPDFESVGVRWQISLDGKGKLVGLIPLLEDPDAKKPRPKQLTRPKSDPDFVSHGRSYFLCDSLERCLLFTDDAVKLEKRRVNQVYFVGLVEEAAKACPGEANRLGALARFLRSEDELAKLHGQLRANKALKTQNAKFTIDDIDLLASEEIRRFWRGKSEQLRAQKEEIAAICLATGQVGPVCRTTGFIKLLGTDTKLISFNKECPAFESFGLSQAANAPISMMAEVRSRSALNALIQKSRTQGLVFNDTVHLHWSRQPMELDPLDPVVSGDPEAVGQLLQSVRQGREMVGLDANAYYALSLSGNGARIVVRDWLESTVSEVQYHIAEWFEDLAVVPPDGIGLKREFKLAALLYGMVRKKLDELPPQLPTQLLHGALRGRGIPLPQPALVAALRRQRLDQENKLLPSRMALIKLCLIRSPDRHRTLSTKEDCMTEGLNPDARDPAYLCGRLFAVFDRLQYLALGGVNAGVVERYYASASNTPALVMGRLFRNAQFHMAKVEGGTAENVRKDFEAVTSALGQQFPTTLTLEGQGRFALGYYHQKADYRRRSAERKAELASVRG